MSEAKKRFNVTGSEQSQGNFGDILYYHEVSNSYIKRYVENRGHLQVQGQVAVQPSAKSSNPVGSSPASRL
jgi:hypothetical protein